MADWMAWQKERHKRWIAQSDYKKLIQNQAMPGWPAIFKAATDKRDRNRGKKQNHQWTAELIEQQSPGSAITLPAPFDVLSYQSLSSGGSQAITA
jgi:hypothetical protein